jgi:hypothetical protein
MLAIKKKKILENMLLVGTCSRMRGATIEIWLDAIKHEKT